MKSKIINNARLWLGTKFKHQGRVKKSTDHAGGCDCLGLLICVANELDLKSRLKSANGKNLALASFDVTEYKKIPDGANLEAQLRLHLHEVSEIQEADILLFEFDNNPQHLGIVASDSIGLTVIHANSQARKVVEHRLDGYWSSKIVGIYRLEGM